MGLLSFLKRGDANSAASIGAKAGAKSGAGARPVADAADAVQHLRLRARHRLIGAALLVGLGVIGFPLLFETQPRPIPVDLPIDIPSKESVRPLQVPAQLQPPTLPPLAAVDEPSPEKASAPAVGNKSVETEVEKTAESTKPLPAPVVLAKTEPPKQEPKPAIKVVEKQSDKALEKKVAEPRADKPASQQEAARVQSLLEGKPPEGKASDTAVRAIVQVGAYADAKAAQETRMKVEKLGLKTYTQVVETASGQRVRVRVGPFASKDEADKAAARLRAAGLSPAVLTL